MSVGGDSEATRTALERAAQHLQRGERPEAAGFYRLAARLLSEEGDDERAVEYARLAADLDDDEIPEAPKPLVLSAKAELAPEPPSAPRAKADATGKHRTRRSTGNHPRASASGKHRAAREADAPAPPAPAVALVTDAPVMIPAPVTTNVAPIAIAPSPNEAPSPPRRSQPPPVPLPRPRSAPPPPPRVEPRAPSQPPAAANVAVASVPLVTVLASNFNATPASSWSIPPPAPAARRIDYVRAYLPSLRCFDELGTDRVRELARQVQVLEFNDGDSLFATGDACGPLLIITSGTAHVDRPGASPFDLVLSSGEMLGVLSVLHADRRLASARARGPLEAFALAPSLVRSLAREFATFRHFLHNIAAPRIDSLLPHLSRAIRGLSSAPQRQLLEALDCYTVDDGTLLQLEGVPVRAAHFVAAGSVEVFGDALPLGTVRHVGAGALIGADALRDEIPPRVTARASGPVLVARIDRAAFRALLNDHPSARETLRDGPGV